MEKHIFVQLARPTGGNFGVTAQGTYIEKDGVVTLVKYNAEAIPADKQKQYSRKLNKGDEARKIAARLTKQYDGNLYSNRPFSAPIHYPNPKFNCPV